MVHLLMKIAIALMGVLLALPAQAARCPHGQIYRVHMGVCVGADTRLAREVLHHPRYHYRVTEHGLPRARPNAPEAPPPEPPVEVVKPQWPAPWKTYNQPRSANGWRL